jgi:hypothetical protein
MHTTRDATPPWRHRAWPVCLWLFLVLMLPCAAAGNARAAAPAASVSCQTSRAVALRLPLAAWYDKVWNKIESSLNNRTGAIQFGLIGMLIALWIIWWRK